MSENSTFRGNSGTLESKKNMGNEEERIIGGGSVSIASVLGEEERSRESFEDGGDRDNNSGTENRWPREETLALVKVRTDMAIDFRDAGAIKAPLWEEVSSKLAKLGYKRSAKKCKEKFENIYKYYRRTKGGRSNNPNCKSYRYFEQLEAFDQINPSSPLIPTIVSQPQKMITSTLTNSTSDEDSNEKKKTTKNNQEMPKFFEKLMNEVLSKQEELHKNFIESIEKYDQERIAREESWKIQEKARIEAENKLLSHHRSIAAAKDAALIAFLQKFADNGVQLPENILTPLEKTTSINEKQENSNTTEISTRKNVSLSSSSRWPRHEVEALIEVRSKFYSEQSEEIGNGNKGPLWEEISATLKKNYGYERSAKRCKEKWENINKYYKRVRDGNKRRHEDSKTCPYFHQLEALHKVKKPSTTTANKVDDHKNQYDFKAEDLLMQMMGQSKPKEINQINVKKAINATMDDNDDDDDENTDDDDNDDEEEDGRDNYQIVANYTSSMTITE